MKRMWAALILMILTVGMGVFGILHTQAVTERMMRTVASAKSAAEEEDRETALALSREAVKDWKDAHKILCLYMIHSRLEEIDKTLAALPELCGGEEKEEFLSECDRGLMQISYLNESETPIPENIF